MASRLLVVNDEPATGKALQGALSREGFDVFLATDDARHLVGQLIHVNGGDYLA